MTLLLFIFLRFYKTLSFTFKLALHLLLKRNKIRDYLNGYTCKKVVSIYNLSSLNTFFQQEFTDQYICNTSNSKRGKSYTIPQLITHPTVIDDRQINAYCTGKFISRNFIILMKNIGFHRKSSTKFKKNTKLIRWQAMILTQ